MRSKVLILFFLLSRFLSSQPLQYELNSQKYLMGTEFFITAVYPDIDSCKKAMYFALKEVERIQSLMSTDIDSSDIYKINHLAGIHPQKVSRETFDIIKRSTGYSKKYDGVFDITIGVITTLWGFNSDKPLTRVPPKTEIDSLVKLVGYNKIILNEDDTTVYLPDKGMSLDLGGIAKGYAVDRASGIMRERGIKNFIVNGGGDIYASGEKEIGKKWDIGIKHPRKENSLTAALNVSNCAVGTSGDYERFVIISGIRYCHIFDTKTGYPSVLSQAATIIAPTTEEAVVLSKYLFILGSERMSEFDSLACLVVSSDGKLHYTAKLKSGYNLQIIE